MTAVARCARLERVPEMDCLDEAAARAVLGRAGETQDVVGVVAVRAGAVGSIYEIHRESSADLVIKLYPEAVADRMRTEAHVYGLLAADPGVPVPQIVAAEDAPTLLPWSYLLMTKLEGQRLADLRGDLTVNELIAVYRQMADVLRRIHEHHYAECGPIVAGTLAPLGSNADFMQAQFADRIRDFESLGGSPTLADQLRDHIDTGWSAIEAVEGGALCHNDYVDGNIIINRDSDGWRVTGVVDVERAIVADPLLDLARVTRVRTEPANAFAAAYGVPNLARLELYELYHVVELRNWFAETQWTEQLPGLDHDIARRARPPSHSTP